jgi:hypothetical protein
MEPISESPTAANEESTFQQLRNHDKGVDLISRLQFRGNKHPTHSLPPQLPLIQRSGSNAFAPAKRSRCEVNPGRAPLTQHSHRRRRRPASGVRLPLRTIDELCQLDAVPTTAALTTNGRRSTEFADLTDCVWDQSEAPTFIKGISLYRKSTDPMTESPVRSPRSTIICWDSCEISTLSLNATTIPAMSRIDATLMTETRTRSLLVKPTLPIRSCNSDRGLH